MVIDNCNFALLYTKTIVLFLISLPNKEQP